MIDFCDESMEAEVLIGVLVEFTGDRVGSMEARVRSTGARVDSIGERVG